MKKKMALFTASALLFSAFGGLAGCSGDPYKGFNDKARLYAERSVLLNSSVREKYWWGDDTLFMFHAYPKDNHAYCASRAGNVGFAAGDTYYDDNVWISREFLNAYEIFGDEAYLQTSENVAKYVWSGWADDELGGIYWCEQKKNSRNTCSNAPASLLFAHLYETTKNGEWLERAKRVYDWTHDTLLDPSDRKYDFRRRKTLRNHKGRALSQRSEGKREGCVRLLVQNERGKRLQSDYFRQSVV